VAELSFEATGASPDRFAIAPAMSMSLRISEVTGQSIEAIALRCQVRIEPARRRYSAAEAAKLIDLFGATDRWAETLRPVQFASLAVMVPGFTGSTDIDVPVPLSYDMEIGSTRYFAGLEQGEVPLLLLFSGTIFRNASGRLAVEQVPWSKEARYRLPTAVWRAAVDAHFPNSAWLRLSTRTLDELQRFKASRALPTWDDTVSALLADVNVTARSEPGR
jgi:hypothetical protein